MNNTQIWEKTKAEFNDYYQHIYAEHLAGGNCHIVLDDYNISDSAIQVCKGANLRNDAGVGWMALYYEERILDLLSDLTIPERQVLVRGEVDTIECENDE